MSIVAPAAASTAATRSNFTALFRRQPGGVAVVTADAGSGPVALTATSVSSVSVDPPLLVLSASDASSAAASITTADTLVVHLIDASEVEIAKRAATSGADRFADPATWSRLPSGEPFYHGVARWIRARVVERVRAGAATVLIAEALEVAAPEGPSAPDSARPVVYHDRSWQVLTGDDVI